MQPASQPNPLHNDLQDWTLLASRLPNELVKDTVIKLNPSKGVLEHHVAERVGDKAIDTFEESGDYHGLDTLLQWMENLQNRTIHHIENLGANWNSNADGPTHEAALQTLFQLKNRINETKQKLTSKPFTPTAQFNETLFGLRASKQLSSAQNERIERLLKGLDGTLSKLLPETQAKLGRSYRLLKVSPFLGVRGFVSILARSVTKIQTVAGSLFPASRFASMETTQWRVHNPSSERPYSHYSRDSADDALGDVKELLQTQVVKEGGMNVANGFITDTGRCDWSINGKPLNAKTDLESSQKVYSQLKETFGEKQATQLTKFFTQRIFYRLLAQFPLSSPDKGWSSKGGKIDISLEDGYVVVTAVALTKGNELDEETGRPGAILLKRTLLFPLAILDVPPHGIPNIQEFSAEDMRSEDIGIIEYAQSLVGTF